MTVDWSDLLLRFIRAAGALASALAGIAALLTDGAFPKRERPLTGWYKDLPFSEYRVTRKGAILLTVILLAPGVQFVGDWIKDVSDSNTQRSIALDIRNDVNGTVRNASQAQLEAEKSAIAQENTIGEKASLLLDNVSKSLALGEEQISRSARISKDLNRSLNPLTNVLVTYWVTVPLDAPELSEYRARLVKGVDEFLNANDRKSNRDAYISMASADGDPKEVGIPRQSSLMPTRNEVIAYYLLRYSGLEFSFFQAHNTAAQLIQTHRPVAGLRFEVSTDSGEKESENYSLHYNMQSHSLQINAFQLPSDPRYWTSDNKIGAVPDLSSTQLAIRIDDTMVPAITPGGERDEAGRTLSRLRSQMQLGSVILRIATRELWLNRKSKMIRLTASDPRPFTVYTMVLPKSLDQLQLH